MIRLTVHNQRFSLSAHRLVKTVTTSALALSAVTVGLGVQAATIRLAPAGSNIDAPADPINDILLLNGQQITFSIFFNNSADPIPTTDINYTFTFDSNELEFVSCNPDVSNKFPLPSFCEGILYSPGIGSNSLNVDLNNKQQTLVQQPEFELASWTFRGKNVNPWPGDGDQDAFVQGSNNYTNREVSPHVVTPISSFQSNNLEVQQPVPAPVPFLGVGAAFGSIRKLRKFSSQLKTFSLG